MRPSTRTFYVETIRRVIAHVATHLDEAVDLSSLAASAGLSTFHFHRVFRGMVGETPMEFIRRLRLERAAWQIVSTQAPVTAIAFDAGYDAHESFTRAFRQHFGASPSEFRDTPRAHHHLAASCGVHFEPHPAVIAFAAPHSGGPPMDVRIEQRPARRLAAARHIGPYNQIGRAFARLGSALGPAMGRLAASGAAMMALYHDDPESAPADELRSDAAVVVPEDFVIPTGLSEQRLPPGRYASTLHVGPYEQLGDVWLRFMGEWLPASGERAADSPALETYLNNPETTPKAEWQTVLSIPLV